MAPPSNVSGFPATVMLPLSRRSDSPPTLAVVVVLVLAAIGVAVMSAFPVFDSAKSELADRKRIDRAKAILMRTRGMSEPDAYALLRKTAMNQNRRIADIAESLIVAAGLLDGKDTT